MPIRTLFLIIFLLARPLAYGQVSLYEQIYKLYPKQQKPFILLNFNSRDCINCRSGISYILPELSKSVGDTNIVILIDHKNLLLYLKKYPELFGKYTTQISQELSSQVSSDGRSRLLVIGNNKKSDFDLNVLDKPVLRSIVDTFHSLMSDNAAVDFTKMQTGRVTRSLGYSGVDTIFEQYEGIFEATKDGCLVFSKQFQIGRIIDFNDASSKYFEFGIDIATIVRLNDIVSKSYPMKYLPADSSQQVLRLITLPTIYIENIRFAGDKCYVAFKYNCVSLDGILATGEDIGIRSRYFIGELDLKDKPISLLSDLSNYNDFYLIDTFVKNGKVFNPNFHSIIDVLDGRVSIRWEPVNTDLTGKIADTSLYISNFMLDKENKQRTNSLYHLAKIKAADQLILRLGIDQTPYLWNQTKMEFYDGKGVTITKVLSLIKDSLTYVYDFHLDDDLIEILGVFNNSQTYLIQYHISNGKINRWKLEDKDVYSNLRFTSRNSFVGFVKDIKTDKINATLFSIH